MCPFRFQHFWKRILVLLLSIFLFNCETHAETNETESVKDESNINGELPTAAPVDSENSDKESDLFSHVATTIIAETNKATESATSSVLETTEGEVEGNDRISSSGITPTAEIQVSTEFSREVAPEHTFAVWDSKGKICLLAKFHAVFSISYPNKGREESVSVELPENIKSRGKCDEETKSALQLSWDEYALNIWFSEISNEGESKQWAVTSMELRYDTSAPLFDGAANVGKKTARSKDDLQKFKTDAGRSYYCPTGEINLYASGKKVASVKMKDIHLQPFYVENGEFSTVQRCDQVVIGGPEEPFVQDETVPLAVGLTLTILTLIIVLGFSVHRAYTMRKVDYNSME